MSVLKINENIEHFSALWKTTPGEMYFCIWVLLGCFRNSHWRLGNQARMLLLSFLIL